MIPRKDSFEGRNSRSGDQRKLSSPKQSMRARSFHNSVHRSDHQDVGGSPLQRSLAVLEPDALQDLSKSLLALPPRQGQLFAFLSVFSTMGRQGCISIAQGTMPLPPESFRCRAPLANLHAKYSRRERSYSSGYDLISAAAAFSGDNEVDEIEPMPDTTFGTQEDNEKRLVYAYALAFLLQEQVLATELLGKVSSLPVFGCQGQRVPSISILRFVQRLFKYLPCTKEMYVVALVFIDRVIAYNPGMCVTASNVHRLLFISMLVAAKFFDDLFYANFYMAKVGGVSVEEVLELEVEFLAAIRFSLYVDKELFDTYLAPFEQLVGVLRILPLESNEGDPVPSFRQYPSYGRWSWTSVDELFYHILNEKQKQNGSFSSASSASILSADLDLSEDAEWNRVRVDSKKAPLAVVDDIVQSSSSDEDYSDDAITPTGDGDKSRRKHRHHHHHHHHHRHHRHHDEKHRSKNRDDGSEAATPVTPVKADSARFFLPGEKTESSASASSSQIREKPNVGRLQMNAKTPRVNRFKDGRRVHRGADTRHKFDRSSHSV